MVWFKNIVNPCKPKNIIASSTECESVQVWGRCKCGVGASVGSAQVWGRRKCGVGASVGSAQVWGRCKCGGWWRVDDATIILDAKEQ